MRSAELRMSFCSLYAALPVELTNNKLPRRRYVFFIFAQDRRGANLGDPVLSHRARGGRAEGLVACRSHCASQSPLIHLQFPLTLTPTTQENCRQGRRAPV